jgi:hypothetical protein
MASFPFFFLKNEPDVTQDLRTQLILLTNENVHTSWLTQVYEKKKKNIIFPITWKRHVENPSLPSPEVNTRFTPVATTYGSQRKRHPIILVITSFFSRIRTSVRIIVLEESKFNVQEAPVGRTTHWGYIAETQRTQRWMTCPV